MGGSFLDVPCEKALFQQVFLYNFSISTIIKQEGGHRDD